MHVFRDASMPARLLNTRLSELEHQAYLQHRLFKTPWVLAAQYTFLVFPPTSASQGPQRPLQPSS